MTIHWCGTNAPALPGLRGVLSRAPVPVVVWSADPSAVSSDIASGAARLMPIDPDRLATEVERGDILVATSSADEENALAQMAVNKGAHCLFAGPVTERIRALEGKALLAHTSIVGELGVRPGIDHLLARHMVAAYRASPAFDPSHAISLVSYAGSLPQGEAPAATAASTQARALWRALSAPSRAIREFHERRINLGWDAPEEVTLPLATPERFEVLPHGDAVPLLDQYGIDPTWPIRRLDRGLLRPLWWSATWGQVLSQIETLAQDTPQPTNAPDTALTATGGSRVVIYAEIVVEGPSGVIWHQSGTLDAIDTGRGAALDRLTGRHLRLGIETLLREDTLGPGIHTSCRAPQALDAWLREIAKEAQHFKMAHS